MGNHTDPWRVAQARHRYRANECGEWEWGRIEARTGLQMMPTFPRSPLSFRTAGFPQYGWKAGFPSGAFPCRRLKPAPCMRRPTSSLHPPFVRLVVTTVVPHCVGPQTRSRTALEDHYSSAPGALVQVRVIVSRSVILSRPQPSAHGHTAISPHGGLYAMPSLCGSA